MGPTAQYALARAAALTGDTAAPGLSLRKDSPLLAAATAYSGAQWLPTWRRLSTGMTMPGGLFGGCLEPPNSLGADTSLRGQAASVRGNWSWFKPRHSSPLSRTEAGDKELPGR